MYIPQLQSVLTGALALVGSTANFNGKTVVEGSVLDYCGKECIDDSGDTHCTKPFALKEGNCYTFEWKTDGTLTHTTLELREVADNKNVHYYSDRNIDWTADKSALYYLDFIPRTGCNSTVDYTVSKCDKEK